MRMDRCLSFYIPLKVQFVYRGPFGATAFLHMNGSAESFGDEVESELQGERSKCVGARAS